jgi:multicomponent K+:H+ antiporter subunit D
VTGGLATLLQSLSPHLVAVPILLPLLAGCLLLWLDSRRHLVKAALSLGAVLLNLLVAALLLRRTAHGAAEAFTVYLPSNWEVPFGIVLVLDRLSALMLLVAALVALAALLFALARWDRAGAHFHVLFQLQLMGLNGAFLTADLFNLFVFFEVMLAASYGLLLHGSGPARVRAGLHYLTINLAASSLFLIGASMIYGVAGSLNMADVAAKIPALPAGDRPLLHVAGAILAVAFLAKAAMWPLNFWLAPAYASASAPSGAVFAVLTKVGVYVLLRLSTLMFSGDAGDSAGFGSAWLLWGGMATVVFGALGVLGSQRPARLAGFSVIVSSGTLMAMLGVGRPDVTAGALYYLASSTFAVSAFFLLTELMDRSRHPDPADQRAPEDEEDHLPFALADQELQRDANLDDDEAVLIGRAIPAATVLLGAAFIACALLLAGLPPLSGFVGKFLMLAALLNPPGAVIEWVHWLLLAIVTGSGLLSLVALSRTGMRFFWTPVGRAAPVARSVEYLPIVMLVTLCLWLALRADVVFGYTRATAELVHAPRQYIDAVFAARPVPAPAAARP